ncbi:hypothetical protein MTP99_019555 [Tenebrio molitor]|nr:hypothetical protein MTP99_019555 [Tenebrio molitor]
MLILFREGSPSSDPLFFIDDNYGFGVFLLETGRNGFLGAGRRELNAVRRKAVVCALRGPIKSHCFIEAASNRNHFEISPDEFAPEDHPHIKCLMSFIRKVMAWVRMCHREDTY